MRREAFIVAILGMFILLLLLNLEPKEVEDLENLEINMRVELSGKVVSERLIYEDTKLLELDNGIELVCECLDDYEGLEVSVVGVVEEYEGKKQVRVLRISGGE